MAERELVVVRTFNTRPEADIAKSALDAAQIESMVVGDDAGGLQPGLWEGRGEAERLMPDGGPRATDYDSVAAGYDVRYRTYDYKEIRTALETFLGTAPLYRILEAGCGTGFWLRAIAGRANLIVCLDRSAGMIGRAKGGGAALVRGAAERLPFRDATVDRVVCINALHHFNDRDRFFEECRRVLTSSGGVFMVGLDPHGERDTWWIYDYFPETR